MKTSFFIARRYLFSGKKTNLINLISMLSVVGLAVGTAALVIVLSVFNGLEELTMSLYAAHHPDIQIKAAEGKSFKVNDSLRQVIKEIEGVSVLTEVLEDNALLRYGDLQMAVNIKGVSDNFLEQYPIADKLVSGEAELVRNNIPYALVGLGVQMQLSVSLQDLSTPLVCWYPRKKRRINLSDPLQAFNQNYILPGGVLAIEQQFDQSHVIVPLVWANELMEYGDHRTSLEIKVSNKRKLKAVQAQLSSSLGSAFSVKNLEEQQESILRAVKIERLFVFIALSFILAIASFNIFFSLTMLAIEKQRDIAVLMAMGANRTLVRQIFLHEGLLIAFGGALIGLAIGFMACFLQQQFGWVGLGVESTVVQSYPVKLIALDFTYISMVVVLITVLASFVPARNAARVKVNQHL